MRTIENLIAAWIAEQEREAARRRREAGHRGAGPLTPRHDAEREAARRSGRDPDHPDPRTS